MELTLQGTIPDPVTDSTLAWRCKQHNLRKKQIFYLMGDYATKLYEVVRGSIELAIDDEDGRRILLEFVECGETFGEETLRGARRAHTARACSNDTLVIELPHNPTNELRVLQHTQLRYVRVRELLSLRAGVRRVTRILEWYPELSPTADARWSNASTIAALAGYSREMVTRILVKIRGKKFRA